MQQTLAPAACQRRETVSKAAASVLSVGVRMQRFPEESLEKEAPAPACSVPAMGCPPRKLQPGGIRASHSFTIAALTLPPSVTMQPGEMYGAISATTAGMEQTGTEINTTCEFLTPMAASWVISSQIPRDSASSRLARDLPIPTTLLTAPASRSAR